MSFDVLIGYELSEQIGNGVLFLEESYFIQFVFLTEGLTTLLHTHHYQPLCIPTAIEISDNSLDEIGNKILGIFRERINPRRRNCELVTHVVRQS